MSESLGLTKQQTKNLMKFISDNISMPVLGAGGGFAPIGTLNYYMGTVAPQGWLICDGTVYNIADYPEFATFIASNYGSTNAFGGDGITTFAVPDCRGEFARMIGTNSHANQGSGAEIGEHQNATETNAIGVSYEGGTNYLTITGENNASDWGGFLNADKAIGSTSVGKYLAMTNTTQSQRYPRYSVRPTNTSWNFIVKATVSGDANGFNYSTEEQVGGTWIDGRNWYYKTIDCGVLSNKSTKSVPHLVSNLETIIKFEGFTKNSTGTCAPLPQPSDNDTSSAIKVWGTATDIVIANRGSDQTSLSAVVTIRYIKNS